MKRPIIYLPYIATYVMDAQDGQEFDAVVYGIANVSQNVIEVHRGQWLHWIPTGFIANVWHPKKNWIVIVAQSLN